MYQFHGAAICGQTGTPTSLLARRKSFVGSRPTLPCESAWLPGVPGMHSSFPIRKIQWPRLRRGKDPRPRRPTATGQSRGPAPQLPATSVPWKSHESTTASRVHAIHTQHGFATPQARKGKLFDIDNGRNISAGRSADERAVLGVPPAPAGLRRHAACLRQVPCGRHRLPGVCRQEAIDLAGSWPGHVPSPKEREEEGPSRDPQQQDTAAPSQARHARNTPQRLHLGRPRRQSTA